jgi:hypothetical protein
MAVHVPVQPRHLPHLRLDRDLLPTASAIVLLGAVILALLLVPPLITLPDRSEAEARSLVEFRIGERAAGISEADSLIDFRAGERVMH